MADAPIEVAGVLAAEYGDVLEPANYIRGVAISGRLRLHRLAPDGTDPAAAIAETVARSVTPEALAALQGVDGSVHAGYVWANELSDATNDDRYSRFLAQIADYYLYLRSDGLPQPVDADARVEAAARTGRRWGRMAPATCATTAACSGTNGTACCSPATSRTTIPAAGSSAWIWRRGASTSCMTVAPASP